MIKYFVIGRVIAPWGVNGEIKIEPLTDNIDRFKCLESGYLDITGEIEMPKLKVQSVKFLTKNYVVLKFESIDTIEDARKIQGAYIKVNRKDAVKLPKGHYFIFEIVGLKVYDLNDRYLGVITEVLQTGANDVYVMNGDDGRECLIPAIKQVVKDIDLNNKTMTIDPLEGMI